MGQLLDRTEASTAASSSGNNTAPDEAVLPVEYGKVIAQLKKRGEKGHMILALNEVRHLPSPVSLAPASACYLLD